MKAIAMWAALGGVLGMGCLGEGSGSSHSLALVDLDVARDLYSPDGCGDLAGSGLALDRVGVEGAPSLVAWVAEEEPLCVETDPTLGIDRAGADDLRQMDSVELGGGSYSPATDPDPEPDDQHGASLSPDDPDPEPDCPPGVGVASMTLGL